MYFKLSITLLAGIAGLYFGTVGLRDYRNITHSAASVTFRRIMKTTAYLGIAGTLVFFALIAFLSILDENYVWNAQKFSGAILISSILGLVITLGGLYQVYTTAKFRDLLIKKYSEKVNRNKNR